MKLLKLEIGKIPKEESNFEANMPALRFTFTEFMILIASML
jgi:hypothetical protein